VHIPTRTDRWPSTRAALAEVVVVLAVYAGYSLTRLVADDSPGPALQSARTLLRVERYLGLDVEAVLNGWFVDHLALGLAGSYYYATAHYVVTAVVLVWLWRRGPTTYVPARRALLVATLGALTIYLLMPMAPPRLIEGYTDVLQLSSAHGWWGGDASAPRGFGGYTNQLAAFPSMHAGWALWVALMVQRHVRRPWVRALAWTHAAVTAAVIVGTGNHWLFDAAAGWLVVAAAVALVHPWRQGAPAAAHPRVPHDTLGLAACQASRSNTGPPND
jgi:PAP2 superfamily